MLAKRCPDWWPHEVVGGSIYGGPEYFFVPIHCQQNDFRTEQIRESRKAATFSGETELRIEYGRQQFDRCYGLTAGAVSSFYRDV